MDVGIQPERIDDVHAESLGSFEAFFRASFPTVARSAGLIVRDPGVGEEIAQEAFARLYPKWATMSPGHARPFVYRVSINLARSHLRKHGRLRPGSVPDQTAPSMETDAVDRLVIAAALDRLSPRQRICVVLIDFVGDDTRSVARLLRMKESTVRVHLFRARNAIREVLADAEEPR
jgi:RNA polymerase sigma factor (sigma-70 family)